MQTAEELVTAIDSIGPRDDGQAVALIEADRAAMALAVLGEVRVALGKYYEHAVGPALNEVAALVAKYSAKVPHG